MKIQILVVLLLAAALAAVAWFALRGGGDAELRPGGLPPAVDASRPGEAAGAPAPASAAEPVADAAGGVAVEVGAQRAAAPVTGPGDAGSGRATIRGRLVDAAGAVRAGVELDVHSWPSMELGGVEVAGAAIVRGGKTPRQRCTTQADGGFVFAVEADRSGSLELIADELVFQGEPPQFRGRGGDQDLGDVVAVPSAILRGVVHDQGGQPVGGVKVAAQIGLLGFGGQSGSETGADGRFTIGKLRPGAWTLRTASSRFLPTVDRLELKAGEQRTDLVIVVRPGQAIAGQVIDERGLGVAGMKVGVRRREQIGGVDVERFSAAEAAVTDDDGFFTLSGLTGETVTVRAFGAGHTQVTQRDVAVGTGNLLLRVERCGRLAGVLVTADGTPIAGSTVSARRGDGADAGPERVDAADVDMALPPIGDRSRTTTDEQGRFALDDVPPGAVTVSARGKTHRPANLSGVRVVPGGSVADLRLIADAGATLRVAVVDADRRPARDARVRVERAAEPAADGSVRIAARAFAGEDVGEPGDAVFIDGQQALGTATTDADGVAELKGLPSGRVVVRAEHGDFAPAVPLTVELPRAGAIDAALVLRAADCAQIAVTRSDGSAAAGVEVLLEPSASDVAGAGDARRKTDAEGRVRFDALAAGEYEAKLVRPPRPRSFGGMSFVLGGDRDTYDASAQRLTVVAGETTALAMQLPQLTRFHGVVRGAEGPLGGCAVELERLDAGLQLPGMGGVREQTAADGSFAFADVESGRYLVRYGKPEQIVKASIEIDVPPGTPELERELVLRTGTVRVRVQARDGGGPVERAEVTLARGGGGQRGAPVRREVMMVAISTTDDDSGEASSMTFGGERALTDADGLATLTDVPVGSYTLRIEHPGYAPAEKDAVVVNEARVIDCGVLELSAAGRIRGRVFDAGGQPVPAAFVEHRKVGSEAWSDSEFASAGAYRLQGLAGGSYELRARRAGPGASDAFGAVVTVEVSPGETAVADLTVPGN